MKQKKYSYVGTTLRVVTFDPETLKNEIIPKIYICQRDDKGFYLEQGFDSFEIKETIYGNVYPNISKIMRAFEERKGTTGILLSGQKGSGKSLLSKLTANKCIENNIPVILINQDFCGDAFNEFITGLGECALIFDEFEKVYNKEHQQLLLSLLDGVMSSKKLIIFTVNKSWEVNECMLNRPGRIYYHFKYKGLDIKTIREYCNINLTDKNQIEKIIEFSSFFFAFNFDMLQCIVEEMNRYNLTLVEVIDDLNLEAFDASKNDKCYEIKVFKDNKELTITSEGDRKTFRNPYQSSIDFYVENNYISKDIEDKDSITGKFNLIEDEVYLKVNNKCLKSVKNGILEFEVDGYKVIMEEIFMPNKMQQFLA